ncbi:inactive RESTRICTED TEV MOVEMENT 2-like [Olea europaea subsp. europaea]|uniref:Inactive RESTRICTED TEV MOVEMENT 2-like n=1 Tax=Olea europaea subsp. europaea TaxID=158383 RepID=A0A8S0TY84_OLEEU|nr:inactive RESTRICTED TEV MOVEMENT 2-like [Olea europaea subsp. europaea]
MEARPADTFIEEFEPFCKWERKDDRDVLEIHLREFKKEQLKVQISNLRILKISGERPLDGSKKSRFYKEVQVPKDFDSTAIRAKFVNGYLYIVMPKKTSLSEKREEAESLHEDQTKEQPQNGSGQKSRKQETSAPVESAETTPAVSERAVWPTLLTLGEVVVSLAALVGLIAYVVYMYRFMVPQGDE